MTIPEIISELRIAMAVKANQMGHAMDEFQERARDKKSSPKDVREAFDEMIACYEEIHPAIDFILENNEFAKEAILGYVKFARAVKKKETKKPSSKKKLATKGTK